MLKDKDKKEKLDIKKMKKLLVDLQETFEKDKTAKAAPVSEHEDSTFSDASDLATHDTDLTNDLNVKQIKNVKYNEILEALKRIEDGEYGICEECGAEIGAKRLDVYPTSKMCIACQEEFEKHQRSKKLVKTAKNKDEDQSE